MIIILKKIFYVLKISQYQKKFFWLLLGSLLVLSCEMLGFGLIIPVFKSSIDQEFSTKIYQFILRYTPFTFPIEFLSYVLISTFFVFYLFKLFIVYKVLKFQSTLISDLTLLMSNRVLNIFKRTPYIEYIKINFSDLIKLNHTDIYHFSELLRSVVFSVTELSVIVSVIVISFYINFLITSIFILYLLIIFLIYFKINKKRINSLAYNRNIYLGEKNNYLYQFILGFKEVLIFKNFDFYLNKINNSSKNFELANNRILFSSQIPRFIFEIIFLIPIIFFLFYLNLYGYDNITSLIPVITFFIFSLIRVLPSFNKIVVSIQNIYSFSPSLNNLHSYFLTNENKYFSDDNFLDKVKYFDKLSINDIKYSYSINENFLINGLNFEITRGDKILIFGPSGSGKSTLLDIIVGLLKSHTKKIQLNSKLYSFEDYSKISNLFSYVPQNIYIFKGTIIENILMGENFNKNKFDEIVDLLDLKLIIPSNFSFDNYLLDDRGLNLSGGQRQRIGIARALYREHQILILDESTNSLDAVSEEKISSALLNRKDLTIIAISHNPNVKRFYNRVIELGVNR